MLKLEQANETGHRVLIDSETGEIHGTIRRIDRGRYAYSLPHWTDTEIVVAGSLAYAQQYLLDVAHPAASWIK